MGVARQAGENVRKNAQSLDFGQILQGAVAHGYNTALNSIPASSVVRAAMPMAADFVTGVAEPPKPAGSSVTVRLPAPKPAASNGFRDRLTAATTGKGGSVLDLVGNASRTGDSFSKLLQAVADANGGKVSMHDIANLSDVAYKRAAAAPRPVGAKDTAGNQILGLADELFTQRMAQAQAAKAAGDLQTAQQLQDSAVKERMGYLQSILGANPFDIGAALNLPPPGTE